VTKDPLQALARLADPVRRRLYDVVASRSQPTSRETAAEAAGVRRSLAAYHLDKLVADGLLETSYARTGERTGPGAGRTSKLYRRADAEFSASVPARDYERAAMLMADAIDAGGQDAHSALMARARAAGLELAAGGGPLVPALAAAGYEPYLDDGTIRLRNCPFHRLADRHRDLVCAMNLALVGGLVEALADEHRRPLLDRREHGCCVAIPAAESLV
jgi:predicted ArsR family transcriptional regulator